jgi:spore coat polysaccharide biosynthesis predicted glycosyltransferase SpsG
MSLYLFHLAANPRCGYGHLARVSVLAEELTHRGHAVVFASYDRVDKTHWFRTVWQFVPMETEDDLLLLADDMRPDAILCDLPSYDRTILAALRVPFRLIVFDDFQTESLPADLLINTQILWSEAPADSRQQVLGGPRYALIPPEVRKLRRSRSRRDLVLTMGGSDPNNLTTFALEWLRGLSRPITMTIVQGPGYRHARALHAALQDYPHRVHIASNVTRMAPLLAAHTLAVSGVGVTLYELAALGVPTVAVVEEERHAPLATAMQRAGSLRALSAVAAQNGKLAHAVDDLLSNATHRAALSRAGRRLIDGQGPARVAAAIEALTVNPGSTRALKQAA